MTAAGTIARTAGVLGHELRNPLAAAVTGVALLEELIDQDDPRRRVVDGVVVELQRLTALLDGYLDLARCRQPRQLPVGVERLCRAVAARRASVHVDVPATAMVTGDAVLLERLLENLVDNAFHAGARQVHITARPTGTRTAIVVDDDGPGVPPALRQKIFEPGFSRTHGTGLGLGIAAEIARSHHGVVRCVDKPQGARFVVELPALAWSAKA